MNQIYHFVSSLLLLLKLIMNVCILDDSGLTSLYLKALINLDINVDIISDQKNINRINSELLVSPQVILIFLIRISLILIDYYGEFRK